MTDSLLVLVPQNTRHGTVSILSLKEGRKEIYTPLAANQAHWVEMFVHCPSSFNTSTWTPLSDNTLHYHDSEILSRSQ